MSLTWNGTLGHLNAFRLDSLSLCAVTGGRSQVRTAFKQAVGFFAPWKCCLMLNQSNKESWVFAQVYKNQEIIFDFFPGWTVDAGIGHISSVIFEGLGFLWVCGAQKLWDSWALECNIGNVLLLHTSLNVLESKQFCLSMAFSGCWEQGWIWVFICFHGVLRKFKVLRHWY